ncbi:MAG TPA: PqqD family protein [Acidimicrobiales bacterium]|nr:PqqD family protein [Acidimicrobiales bacterium]
MLRLRHDCVTWRQVGDEVVALDLTRSTYLSVNRTGTLLWNLLVDGASDDELVDTLARAFPPIGRAEAERDVADFVGYLRERGLLEA